MLLNSSFYTAAVCKSGCRKLFCKYIKSSEPFLISRDYTDPHYERKINDLQKRLDAQYDIIEEAENAVEEIRSQIRDLRRDQISSESIYEFLLHFDELYSMASEVERKQFMQTFIDRIDIFPERREDGNWIKNISFKFMFRL